ncbi:DUF7714 family protein [Pseudonocardia sp. GCM10023141]|uniref:DUF7714 family protein n=1 Tax=Pseudonocardia sp. GCM10023141 TaxID=3252653 RepID=UPI00361485F7
MRGPNLVPNRYRGVSVAALPPEVGLDEVSLKEHFLGREAYRRTRFVVARSGTDMALLYVARASEMALFSAITSVDLIAGPEDCAFVYDPEADTGIPSDLARVAREQAPGVYAVAVQGRYAHVSIIVDPQPLRVVVHEVVPPEPAKLLDQARRVLAVSEELPPIELVGELTNLADMAASLPSEHYLLPCRGSGGEVPGAEVSYLDEHPPKVDWTLLGCARSQQIHRHFYGEDPPTVDFCPKKRAVVPGTRLLTKCCLQEEHVESGPGWVSVPWGSSLDHVREALNLLVAQEEPAWAPV